MLFSACSNDDNVVGNAIDNNEGVQQFVVQVASSGDGLQTRAGRPLYSSEAAQQIGNVMIAIKNISNEVVFSKIISSWDLVSTEIGEEGVHGRQYILTLEGKNKLEEGAYTVEAVGYSDNTDYDFTPALPLNQNVSLESAITATLKSGKTDAEEVFAGEAKVSVNANKRFTQSDEEVDNVTVTLHRQVAGSFGYFKNIPAAVNGKDAVKLRLVMSDKNSKITFEKFNSEFVTTNTKVQYIVNGSESMSDKTLYEINLSDWFTVDSESGKLDVNGDGVLNNNDNWEHKDDVHTALVKGSVFAGKFIIPFKLTDYFPTMTLQLLDKDDNVIMSWGVKIPASDMNGDSSKGEVDSSQSVFNICRNHMYNLGVKTENKPGPSEGGTDPENPDPDTDNPGDLSKNQELILKVNDNWEVIHQMELD